MNPIGNTPLIKPGGTKSGANIWAAIQRARIIGAGKRIVTVICDSGLKYLNGDLYK
ncbi:MAG: hypothetical protein WC699_02705 [Bacteroidales bacterium]|jgi:cysteine synthase A